MSGDSTCEKYPGSVSNGNKECVEGSDFCYTSQTVTYPDGESQSKNVPYRASAFLP